MTIGIATSRLLLATALSLLALVPASTHAATRFAGPADASMLEAPGYPLAADLDRDGTLDLAAMFSGGVLVTLGEGGGGFGEAREYATGNNSSYSLVTGDLDGLNGPDLVVADASGPAVAVLRNKGDGSFE